jgi:hypothetical protein
MGNDLHRPQPHKARMRDLSYQYRTAE